MAPLLHPEEPEPRAGSPPGDATSVGLGRLVATLVPAAPPLETERRLVGAVGSLLHPRWALIYTRGPDDGDHRLRATFGSPDGAPARLPPQRREEDGESGEVRVRRAAAPDTDRLPPGSACVAEFEVETDHSVLLVVGPACSGVSYADAELARLEVLLAAGASAIRNALHLEALRSLVLLDPLTGCANRRGFDEQLAVELARGRRYRRPLTLLVVDIDDFKNVNDRHGHDVGDMALRDLGGLLLGAFRTTDRVCRFGGDEFAIILPETPKEDVLHLAERIRQRIEEHFPGTVLGRTLTASFGVASAPEDADSAADLLRAADQALYRAKEHGRNRVVVA